MKKNYPWFEPHLGNFNKKYIEETIKTNFPNEGKITDLFLNIIKKKLNAKYAVGVTSGTAALFLALKALDIGHGDEVIIPNMTFIATANAVEMAGAKPILTDVNEEDLNINIDEIKKNITKKTKAIIPVHISGRTANIKKIISIAKKFKLFVVEDAAEALFSKHNNKYLGSFGDLGCFSLAANKIITTGQGGIIITSNKKLFLKLIRLKDQGRTKKRGIGADDIHKSIGYNFKLTNIQSSVGMSQLSDLNKRIKIMKRNHNIYYKKLKSIEELKLFSFNIQNGELPLWTDAKYNQRDKLIDYLNKYKISCRKFWIPINMQKPFENIKKFQVSKKIYRQLFWLPSSYLLSSEDIIFISNKIIEYFKNIKTK